MTNDPRFKHLRKEVRTKSTYYERVLWEKLRDRRLSGHRFRRNHQIFRYYIDFYCHAKKLAIEVDGAVHETSAQLAYDRERDMQLHALGIRVLRFPNEDVRDNLADVLGEIEAALLSPSS